MDDPSTWGVTYFQVQSGVSAGKAVPFDITKPQFIIGKDSRCDLALDDASLDSAHAVVTFHNGAYFIKPRYHHSKVFINGRQIHDLRQLESGDEVQVGNSVIAFHQGEAAPTALALAARPKPAVIPAYARPAALAIPATPVPQLAYASTGGERAIYFPKPTINPSIAPILFGYFLILSVLGSFFVVAYNEIVRLTTPPSPYAAFAPGTVQMIEFYAEW